MCNNWPDDTTVPDFVPNVTKGIFSCLASSRSKGMSCTAARVGEQDKDSHATRAGTHQNRDSVRIPNTAVPVAEGLQESLEARPKVHGIAAVLRVIR